MISYSEPERYVDTYTHIEVVNLAKATLCDRIANKIFLAITDNFANLNLSNVST